MGFCCCCYIKAEQIHKITLKIVLEEKVVIFRENSCQFVNLLSFTKQWFSSQLEINDVIPEPTEVN